MQLSCFHIEGGVGAGADGAAADDVADLVSHSTPPVVLSQEGEGPLHTKMAALLMPLDDEGDAFCRRGNDLGLFTCSQVAELPILTYGVEGRAAADAVFLILVSTWGKAAVAQVVHGGCVRINVALLVQLWGVLLGCGGFFRVGADLPWLEGFCLLGICLGGVVLWGWNAVQGAMLDGAICVRNQLIVCIFTWV